jgi:2-C-methyl-D-erythritol 4-phosphate cytidylyltransferase
MDFYLIIPASGMGNRFGLKTPKQFYKIDGNEILVHTLNRFNAVKGIKSIFISTKEEYVKTIQNLIKKYKIKNVKKVLVGGEYRQDSVYNALMEIKANNNDRIIVHDAVRPFVSKSLIKNLMEESINNDCVIPALKLTDTIKLTNEKSFVVRTISRENLWSVQTPQIFNYHKLMKSFKKMKQSGFIGTDEASLMEYAGYKVKIIEGETTNIKITTRKDLK